MGTADPQVFAFWFSWSTQMELEVDSCSVGVSNQAAVESGGVWMLLPSVIENSQR